MGSMSCSLWIYVPKRACSRANRGQADQLVESRIMVHRLCRSTLEAGTVTTAIERHTTRQSRRAKLPRGTATPRAGKEVATGPASVRIAEWTCNDGTSNRYECR